MYVVRDIISNRFAFSFSSERILAPLCQQRIRKGKRSSLSEIMLLFVGNAGVQCATICRSVAHDR